MDAAALAEMAKYARMWARPEYRRWSPGEESAQDAIRAFGGTGSLIDFGCGEGRGLDVFRTEGFSASGIDIVGLRPDVRVACLWDLPDDISPADFGYCADVMEHIPPARVGDVLAGIAGLVWDTVYFRIATVPDTMGQLIGETLHLSVKPAAWWVAKVREHMHVERAIDHDAHVVIVAHP